MPSGAGLDFESASSDGLPGIAHPTASPQGESTSESRVALITGGGSGIGAAVARQLLDAGHRVAVTGRGEERLRGFAEELGRPGELLTFAGDTAVYDDVRSAVDATVKAFGRLDTVVANAGFATHDTVAEGDPAGWTDMVLTNVLGPALLIRASIDALKETRGRIVLVGSVAGFVHRPGNVYGATMGAPPARAQPRVGEGGDRTGREHAPSGDRVRCGGDVGRARAGGDAVLGLLREPSPGAPADRGADRRLGCLGVAATGGGRRQHGGRAAGGAAGVREG
ncbi:hypothetical protein GCM10023086_43220 [Streptomyces venetus]|uniref:SDR family NAD(P)-dependent oxidoreductase n=1 Tax=Streptomyces venetus TaxID=1701086 RepID=A0ABP8G868_9ACTN